MPVSIFKRRKPADLSKLYDRIRSMGRIQSHLILAKAVLIPFFIIPACQGGTEPSPSTIQTLEVSAASTQITVGETDLFEAAAKNNEGHPMTGVPIRWASSQPDIATIDENGLATGVAVGTTTITASSGSITSIGIPLTVVAGPDPPPLGPALQTIAVSAPSTQISVGETDQFEAIAKDSEGRPVTGIPIRWASSHPDIATITSSGLATGIAAGNTTITASSGSISSAGIILTVVAGPPSPPPCAPTPTWEETGFLNIARSEHEATLLSDGRLLVTGGQKDGFLLNTAEIYNPASGTWSFTNGVMTHARDEHTATLLLDGRVLIAGGFDNDASQAWAELYDPMTNNWSATESLISGRNNHTATLLSNGKVFVVGGRKGPSLASTELYDPETGRWFLAADMNNPRHQHTATPLPNGKVLVVGGGASLSSAELYDPTTGFWSATGSLFKGRNLHTATLLQDGRVLVTGGRNNGIAIDTTEIYNPATEIWAPSGNLATSRYEHTATLLPDGRLLVTGGISNGIDLSSTELYDPGIGNWTAGPPLITSRWLHTAALMPNGRVLIAGGRSAANITFDSAELYSVCP